MLPLDLIQLQLTVLSYRYIRPRSCPMLQHLSMVTMTSFLPLPHTSPVQISQQCGPFPNPGTSRPKKQTQMLRRWEVQTWWEKGNMTKLNKKTFLIPTSAWAIWSTGSWVWGMDHMAGRFGWVWLGVYDFSSGMRTKTIHSYFSFLHTKPDPELSYKTGLEENSLCWYDTPKPTGQCCCFLCGTSLKSDESHSQISPVLPCFRVTGASGREREAGEVRHQSCLVPTVQASWSSAVIWGCCSWSGLESATLCAQKNEVIWLPE